MIEKTIQSVTKKETSKGILWEVTFEDGIKALTLNSRIGGVAESSSGKRVLVSSSVTPAKGNYPSAVWLQEMDLVIDERVTAITDTASLRLKCLELAVGGKWENATTDDSFALAERYFAFVTGDALAFDDPIDDPIPF